MSIELVMPSSHLIFFVPFSSCPQSFPASESFPMNWLFASGGKSIGTSASASVFLKNIHGCFPLELTGLISLLSRGLSRVLSTTVQKHQFFVAQPSLWSNSHITLLRLVESQSGIKIDGRNINNLRYADDTILMAESKEELKSLLMKEKEERRTVWRFLKKLEIELPYDPAIPLLSIHTEETRIERDMCITMFTAALFTIARTWKQPRCPSADKWIRKGWYIYTMEYYSATKKNTFELVLMRWMKLEPIIQKEVSQEEKHQYSILTHIHGI